MSRKRPRCEACGRVVQPCRYNRHHQKYCTDPECVRERKRRRQREWYARKRAEDPAFAASERERCASANRRRRASGPTSPPEPSAVVPTPEALAEVVAGMVSQLTDSKDPVLLAASLRRCRDRGRRVAALSSCAPPWG